MVTTTQQKLDYLISQKVVEHQNIKWGSGFRDVIKIGVKTYQYKKEGIINNRLEKNISSLYISMSKSLNKKRKQNDIIIDDIVAPDDNDDKYGINTPLDKPARRLRRKTQTKTIQKWVKQNKENFKQEDHDVQLAFNLTIREGETIVKKSYNTKVFNVFGGKTKLRRGIEDKIKEIRNLYEEDYNLELINLELARLYIDDVKRNIQRDFSEIKMFGTLLNLCGYDLNVGKYEFNNACSVEYHVEMFNKFRDDKWTIERFMKELDMKSIDEGITLNQLIPLYIKYKIGYHVVDFKYHLTASHNTHNYTPTRNYPSLFYMIENNHLYPIVNKEHQRSLSQIKDKPKKTFKPKFEKPIKRAVNIFYHPRDI